MPNAWSEKHERPHGPVGQGVDAVNESDGDAGTADGERARAGAGGLSVWASLHAMAASRHGGPQGAGADLRTRDQLYAEAMRMEVKGRSSMSKAQLARAVRR